jgi:hypothetical protein
MKNKRNVLYCLIILLLAAVIYFPTQDHQKYDTKTVTYQPDVKKSKPEPTSWDFIAVLKDNLIDNEIPKQ